MRGRLISLLMIVTASSLGCDSSPLDAHAGGESTRPALECAGSASAIRVQPTASDIEIGGDRGVRVQFRAVATLGDGSVVEVPAAWRSDGPTAGSIDSDGHFEPEGAEGGILEITARSHGMTATARLGVVLVEQIPRETPPEVVAAFHPGLERRESATLRFTEPASGHWFETAAQPEFVWEGGGPGPYRVRFLSPTVDVSVYALEPRILLPAEVVSWLARSNAGRTVRVEIEAAQDSTVLRGRNALHAGFCLAAERCNGLDDDCDGSPEPPCAEPPFEGDPSICEPAP